ncbi:MAG: PHP domain-containing protein [Methanobacteriota archaeon]|nr:MAG: PHP domain-containing protein [Euryarchaeota archaeon]
MRELTPSTTTRPARTIPRLTMTGMTIPRRRAQGPDVRGLPRRPAQEKNGGGFDKPFASATIWKAFKRRAPFRGSSMFFDLHNHTRHSPDSRVAPADLVMMAQRAGLAGVAITDHNSMGGVRDAQEAARGSFLVIPAIEVSTRSGHVLGYGLRDVVPRGLSVRETVERIVAAGGVPVAAHPYRFWSGLGDEGLAETSFPAHETRNGRTLRRGNERARERARALRVGETGGSDSHFLDEVAKAVTAIDAGDLPLDDVLQQLGQGKTTAEGTDRGAGATARYVTKAVSEWIGRGMRRI